MVESPSDSAPIQGDHQNDQFLVKKPDFRKGALTLTPREEVVEIIGPKPPYRSYRLAKGPSDSAPIQGDHQNYIFPDIRKSVLDLMPREEVVQIIDSVSQSWSN